MVAFLRHIAHNKPVHLWPSRISSHATFVHVTTYCVCVYFTRTVIWKVCALRNRIFHCLQYHRANINRTLVIRALHLYSFFFV